MNLLLRHVLPCDPSTYWERCVLDPEYSRALFLGPLEFVRYDITEQHDALHTVDRTVHAEPSAKGILALIKSSLPYVEHGRFDRVASEYVYGTTHPGAKSVRTRGRIRVTPMADGHCMRVCEMELEVKIPLMGATAERLIADDAKRAYDISAEFTGRWLRG
jgi:hypothetical protein